MYDSTENERNNGSYSEFEEIERRDRTEYCSTWMRSDPFLTGDRDLQDYQ